MNYTMTILTLGHVDLFGAELHEKDIIEIIRKYPLHQVLDLLAKIDILLNITAKGDEKFGKMQGEIIGAVLPPSVIQRKQRKMPRAVAAFFSRGQLTYLRKLALVHCQFKDSGMSIWRDLKSEDISKLFLGATDVFQDEVALPSNETKEDILSYMVKSHFLNQEPELKKKIGRAYLMFVEIKAKIEGYKDVDDLLQGQLGLTALDIISIGFAIISPYFQKREILHKIPVTLNVEEYFKPLKIPVHKVTAVLNLLASDLPSTVRKTSSEGRASGYKMDAFTKKPLLKLEQGGEVRFVCLDLIALIDKFTLNLTWAIGNKSTLTEIMLSYRGSSFEEYLRRILRQYCALHSSDFEFLHIKDYGKNGDEELGDAIVLDRKRKIAIVFEAKAKQFTEEVKASGDLETLVHSFVMPSDPIKNPKKERGAAQQLDSAILKLKKDGLKNKGIDTKDFKFFPILTFYDSFPTNDALNIYFQEIFTDEGLFSASDTFKPEITSISDIEVLIELEADMIDVLLKKHATQAGVHSVLQGYFYLEDLRSKNHFLDDDLEDAFVKIKSNLGVP